MASAAASRRNSAEGDRPGMNTTGKPTLNIVLCGNNPTFKSSVSRLFQEITNKPQEEMSKVCHKREEKIDGCQSVIELPVLSQLSEEEVMRETLHCVSLCDPGVHQFILVTPVCPLTNEDRAEMEKIKEIFYSQEHFMVLFITELSVDQSVSDLVSSTESQRIVSLYGSWHDVMGLKDQTSSEQILKILDVIASMKIEPYSLQMYMRAPEKRIRHELEEKLRERDNKIKEEKIKTLDDEDSPSDAGCLRLLLFGKTGSGKSATGNTILRNNEFHCEDRLELVTTVCQKGVGEINGRSVAVIDTPGLLDHSLTEEQMQEEIMNCISLSAPGPHAFIIVVSVARFTQEERDILDMIKMIFGPKAEDFCIVLITRGDLLRGKTTKQYVEENSKFKELISDCGNRSIFFNNTEMQDQTQVNQLVNMIEEMNQGRCFTNEMFEEAVISTEQKIEMIEEKERQNHAQVEELKAKYDREDMSMRMRLKERKQRADEERERLKNKFREQEETLRRKFEEKEESEQKKQETEDQKQSEEENQQRAEYDQRIEEMKRETEDQIIQYEKQQKEREDRKREEEYKQDQEKMKNYHEHIIAELQMKQEEEMKKRDLEEQMRKKQEEKEREEWKRKIKEAENDKETQEKIKRQMRGWEEEKNRQMREREKEERDRKEKHKKQLREKQEELENKRKISEKEREEEQILELERGKQKKERDEKEREYEEKINEMKIHEQLERERKEEDEERQVEKRKRWEKMIEDLKREQEEEFTRREREERERIDREEKEWDEIKQKLKEEIEKMKKKHEDEARKQREELNDFRKRKEQHIQELKKRLQPLNEKKRRRDRQLCQAM